MLAGRCIMGSGGCHRKGFTCFQGGVKKSQEKKKRCGTKRRGGQPWCNNKTPMRTMLVTGGEKGAAYPRGRATTGGATKKKKRFPVRGKHRGNHLCAETNLGPGKLLVRGRRKRNHL